LSVDLRYGIHFDDPEHFGYFEKLAVLFQLPLAVLSVYSRDHAKLIQSLSRWLLLDRRQI
jgi:hypothetical protein